MGGKSIQVSAWGDSWDQPCLGYRNNRCVLNSAGNTKGGDSFSKGDDFVGERGNKTTLEQALVMCDIITILA